MERFMKIIFMGLPAKYRDLHDLDPDEFVELMRSLMSRKFRMMKTPKRLRLQVNGNQRFVGYKTIMKASMLLDRILDYIRKYGYRPDKILRLLSGC